MLNLVPKKNVIVTNLSGGMKRKVNLGIALIGDSKVRDSTINKTLRTCKWFITISNFLKGITLNPYFNHLIKQNLKFETLLYK